MFGAFRPTKDIKSRQLIVSLMADIRPSSDRRIEAATVSATRFENGPCFPKYHSIGNALAVSPGDPNENAPAISLAVPERETYRSSPHSNAIGASIPSAL